MFKSYFHCRDKYNPVLIIDAKCLLLASSVLFLHKYVNCSNSGTPLCVTHFAQGGASRAWLRMEEEHSCVLCSPVSSWEHRSHWSPGLCWPEELSAHERDVARHWNPAWTHQLPLLGSAHLKHPSPPPGIQWWYYVLCILTFFFLVWIKS